MTERVLGPTGGQRRRWSLLIASLAALSLMLVLALGASANVLPGSQFEIDDVGGASGANLILDAGPGSIDWATVTQVQAADLATGQTDDSYKGGMKEDTACPETETGSIPNNKSDLLNFGSYFEPEAGGPGWLHVFWRRVQEPNGTTNMDFEFNKSSTDCDGAGSSKNVTRTVGDVLLQYDIDQGGANATLTKREWLGSAWSEADVLDANEAIGSINQVAITNANSDGLGAMSARTFGEASFDLSQVFDSSVCESFGSAMLKSRSSDSFTSQLKDFIAPIPVNISNCGKVIVRKVTDPAGNSASFNYSKTFATAPATANTFSLTGQAATDDITFNGVLFGAGSVTEDLATLPAGWEFVGLNCSASTGVTVNVASNVASWSIDAQTDIVDCTYTNRLRQGAILVTKTRKHAASGPGDHPHAGVDFTVNGVTKATDANGQACFDGLGFQQYAVAETLPTGYSADQALSQNVTVDSNATCAASPYVGETVSFGNTPLTDVSVVVDSLVPGGTKTDVDCDNGVDAVTGAGGDGTIVIANDEEPVTIVCTIVIDP